MMRTPSRWARPKLIRPPGFILPCRPTLAAKVPTGDGWLHELGEQRVTVQHVNVNEGGQAIVGNVSGGGGVPQKKVETTS